MSDFDKTREELLQELKALRSENQDLRENISLQNKDNFLAEEDIQLEGSIKKKLIESEQRFRELFNNTPAISVQGYDKNRKVIFWNKASEVLYGYSPEEAIGKKLEDLIIPDKMKEGVVAGIENWLRNGIPIPNSELTLKKANGSDVNVFSSHCMLRNIYGKLELYCIDIDLDPLKKAERELLKNQSRLRLAIEVAKIGYWDYDCKTDKVEWSDGHHKLYGIKLEEFRGTLDHVQECVHPDDRQQGIDNLNKAMEHDEPFDNTYRVIYPDGTIHWLHSYGYVFKDTEGKPLNIFGVTRDITASKMAKDELIKAKELAEKNDRLKTAFINNISHEIRTPLNSIAGFGQLIVSDQLSLQQRMKYIDIIQQNSDRLVQTITDIIDISMITSDSMSVYPKEIKLDDVLHKALTKAHSLCETTNIKPGLDIPEGKSVDTITSDPELLDKVFGQLISNAVKFTQKGNITIGYDITDNENITFLIKDTGKGIAPDSLQNIFDVFVQEDVSITRGHEGSGIGLTIAKGIVSLLGGRMWVQSTKGQGSTFFFTIPMESVKSEPTLPKKTIAPIDLNGDPIILVAEDDEANYFYFQELLDATGLKHLHAINGKEALKMCTQNPEIALVLMDIKMPVMNGLEATKMIKQIRPELPIIAVTAHAQTGDKNRVIEAGCDAYLHKPVCKQTLEDVINTFIQPS